MVHDIKISTDCVCDLPKEFIDKFQISIMYYYIETETARFQDGKEISSADILECIESEGKSVSSKPASVEEYRNFFKSQITEASHLIHISLARYASAGYDIATEAAKDMDNVHVVDSGHLSGGMGLIVLLAADMAARGASCPLILQELELARNNVNSSFILRSTRCLYLNQRLGKSAHSFLDFWSLHPIIHLKESRMKFRSICYGNEKRYARTYIRKVLKKKHEISTDILFINHAGCSYEFLQFIYDEVKKILPWKNIIVNDASGTIACNAGSGTFGLLFFRNYKL